MGITLMRSQQLGSKVEAAEGTPETLVAADFSGNVKEPSGVYAMGEYERGLVQASLAKRPMLKGTRLRTLTFAEELVGGGAATQAPFFRRLRGCAYALTGLKTIGVGNRTGGEYAIGQTIGNNIVQGSATATGIVVKVIEAGATDKLVYVPVTGAFANAETIYNYASPQVSATASGSPADAGYRARPFTETNAAAPDALTFQQRMGGATGSEIHVMTAARGTGTLELAVNAPALWQWQFQGCPVVNESSLKLFAVGDAGYAAIAQSAIPLVGVAPVVSKGLPLRLGTGSEAFTPVMTRLAVDLGNTLTPSPTITNSDFANSGHRGVRVTDRNVKITLDPENDVSGGKLNLAQRELAGTVFPVYGEVGSPSSANGLFIVSIKEAQFVGDLGQGNRDGIETADLTLMATSETGDDEVEFFHVFA